MRRLFLSNGQVLEFDPKQPRYTLRPYGTPMIQLSDVKVDGVLHEEVLVNPKQIVTLIDV